MKYTKCLTKLAMVMLLGISCPTIGIYAQDESGGRGKYVITGTRSEVPVERSGKTIYKITREDILKQPGSTLADLLNSLPGIHIEGAFGTPGSKLNYNIRGGRNRQAVILIEGVPISDPSSVSNDYDLRLLDANMIEYIEVQKGAASTLYGSGAAAGVINIKLRESEAGAAEYTISQRLGSFKSANTTAQVEGRSFRFAYLASMNFGLSQGISAADEADPNNNYGNDGYLKYGTRVKLNFEESEKKSHQLNMSFDYLKSDFDDGAFVDADNESRIQQFNLTYGFRGELRDRNNKRRRNQDLRGLGVAGAIFRKNPVGATSAVSNAIGDAIGYRRSNLSFNLINRRFDSALPSNSTGYMINVDRGSHRNVKNWLTWISGRQIQVYMMETPDDTPTSYVLAAYQHIGIQVTPGLRVNTGVRMSFYKTLEDLHFAYHFNPVYTIPFGSGNFLKVFGSYATALVAPTLVQKAAPGFGNGSLDAEESSSLEFGTSLYLGKKLTLNLEYFDRTEEKAIDLVTLFDPFGNRLGGIYRNIEGKRELSGIELDFKYQFNRSLTLSGHYASYEFGDPSLFYRIPDQKYGFRASYSLNRKTNFGLNLTHFGDRVHAFPDDTPAIILSGYNLLDLSMSHELRDGKMILSGAVNNLLNEDFVGVYGFNSKPTNFNISVTARF